MATKKQTIDEDLGNPIQSEGQGQEQNMSKEEETGYHKGALSTLLSERNELLRLIQIVDSLIQGHARKLEELGVKIGKKESK